MKSKAKMGTVLTWVITNQLGHCMSWNQIQKQGWNAVLVCESQHGWAVYQGWKKRKRNKHKHWNSICCNSPNTDVLHHISSHFYLQICRIYENSMLFSLKKFALEAEMKEWLNKIWWDDEAQFEQGRECFLWADLHRPSLFDKVFMNDLNSMLCLLKLAFDFWNLVLRSQIYMYVYVHSVYFKTPSSPPPPTKKKKKKKKERKRERKKRRRKKDKRFMNAFLPICRWVFFA